MGNVEIPKWLKDLPVAPEFRPTDTEFSDPIAYISKIEKEASAFGICKIIPPLPKPSKRYVFCNLNKSLSKCPELNVGVGLSSPCSSLKTVSGDSANDREVKAVFTTRHQELGQGTKRGRGMMKETPLLGVHKQVWQSGEIYTLEQFESKSKAFARSCLGLIKEINPLVIETLFWMAASEKPITVEYANDVPGSGFGEPEGLFRYFHRRRRKRASYRSYRPSRENSDCKKIELDNVNNSNIEEVKSTAIKNDPSMSSETMQKSSFTSSTSCSEETSRFSKRRNLNVSDDMEGTAGWKLSNSPWNLQVIARSPGSLTRFMPDDIPGVTSPMVYIGMLFSWFAWHVEDHELHSMNFLHTGSPKTWYSVPGDYAFAFEEVIRTEAYGGSIDRLAALTLLGEKTTLLSPQVVVSSGIPCCRLVQNPGEFVVTFPRAYHVGFSHGFNCGEAANFGTPQWLKVAKEAAVRRAAMNYLPMLSHQQLLYLLTMSFALRVPRSLLPGARSSRLRDRLKEERELSVKMAFIEDILKENNILSVLLGKESAPNVAIWNPDLLPCASKESQLLNTLSRATEENVLHDHSEDNKNTAEEDLFKDIGLCMETLNDLYMDDDDLSCDFQVDSGTLACVACGILGFPFMSVVQPSERASMEVLLIDHPLVQEGSKAEKTENCHSFPVPDGSFKGPFPDLALPTGWNNSRKFLRPRIFCLEHGLQVEELLRSKGGANMRIICHSDYQKMKAHAVAIAEEIDIPFHYKEFPLESASQEDLNLIYLAIDGEDRNECGEDWTSKLGINLQYCVKVRKNSPSNKVQHSLSLGDLFSDGTASDFLNIKWKTKRSRSQIMFNKPVLCKPCSAIEAKNDNVLGKKSDSVIVEKEEKLIQYTRRKYKVKIDCSTSWGEGCFRKHMEEDVSVASCEDLGKNTGKLDPSSVAISGTDSSGLCFSPIGISGVLHDVQVLEATGDMSLNCGPLHTTCSLPTPTVGLERIARQVENQVLEKPNRIENACNLAVCCDSRFQQEEKVTGQTGVDDEVCVSLTLDNEAKQKQQTGGKSDTVECISCNDMLIDQLAASGRSSKCLKEMKNEQNEEHASCSARQLEVNQSTTASVERFPEVLEGISSKEVFSAGLKNLDTEVQKEIHSDGGLPTYDEAHEICQATTATNEKGNMFKNCSEEESCSAGNILNDQEVCLSHELESTESTVVNSRSIAGKGRKRNNELEQLIDNKLNIDIFIRGPCEGLRPRAGKDATHRSEVDINTIIQENSGIKKARQLSDASVCTKKKDTVKRSHKCDLEGCPMSFETKAELQLHKRNRCPYEGCGKRFNSHKYAIIHQRVHEDDRPLKCPWKGCSMSFKWAWARTEHIRVHTGEKPYKCKIKGCGLSFRFVSDFSRHRRKTGHYVNTSA